MAIQTDRTGLGSRIADRLTATGKTQRDLATYLGVKQSAVSQWVTGATTPKKLDEIASFLKTSAAWLRTGAKEEIKTPTPESSQNEKSPRQQALAAQAAAIKAFEDLSPEALEYVDIDALIRMLRSFFVNPEPNIRTDEQKAKIKSK